MTNPVWPSVGINFRAVTNGVECTMRTYYDGIDMSVCETGEDTSDSERKARIGLSKKIARRRNVHG
jgi:hypothetical protein